MRYTYILLLFQLVSLNSFNWYQFWSFCILICVYVCMLSISMVSISIGIKLFIHICFICAYYIPISWAQNLVYAKAWASTLFQLIHFSIGILIQAYACVLLVFHKGREKFDCVFQLVFDFHSHTLWLEIWCLF